MSKNDTAIMRIRKSIKENEKSYQYYNAQLKEYNEAKKHKIIKYILYLSFHKKPDILFSLVYSLLVGILAGIGSLLVAIGGISEIFSLSVLTGGIIELFLLIIIALLSIGDYKRYQQVISSNIPFIKEKIEHISNIIEELQKQEAVLLSNTDTKTTKDSKTKEKQVTIKPVNHEYDEQTTKSLIKK